MSLNRSSYWTQHNGNQIRVKHMTIGDIQCAMMEIDDMEFQRLGDDPYIVQQLCSYGDFCNILPALDPKKDGFALDDWYEFFRNEVEKRLKLLAGKSLRITQKAVKSNFLVKWFKFW